MDWGKGKALGPLVHNLFSLFLFLKIPVSNLKEEYVMVHTQACYFICDSL